MKELKTRTFVLLVALLGASCTDDVGRTDVSAPLCLSGEDPATTGCQEPFSVTPTAIGPARQGEPFEVQFQGQGGPAPYRFLVEDGLPPGLSVDADGLLSGVPEAAGEFGFVLKARDGEDTRIELEMELLVLGQGACVEESCNGVDDDCDGAIDEAIAGVGASCGSDTSSACERGQTVCRGGELVCETTGSAEQEACDGEDNDCDGFADEGLLNRCGECGGLTTESCDGLDNDCDAAIDEGCPCSEGATEGCGTSVGACTAGTRSCGGGVWGECSGTAPSTEICDGEDNDCDGQTDEGVTNRCGTCDALPSEVCDGQDNDCDGLADESLNNLGACQINGCGGVEVCEGGQVVCTLPVEGEEVCDGADNDCDGAVDEGPGGGALTQSCARPNCQTTAEQTCENGLWTPCDYPEEVCDGQDNDCDNLADEGLEALGACTDNNQCGGTLTCVSGQEVCQSDGQSGAETCDGEDNDCDGAVDEGTGGGVCPQTACGIVDELCVDGELRCIPRRSSDPIGSVSEVVVSPPFVLASTGTSNAQTFVEDRTVLLTSDGWSVYNVAYAINGQPYDGFTVHRYVTSDDGLAREESWTIPVDWDVPEQPIVGAAARGRYIWLTQLNLDTVVGEGVWRIDLQTSSAEFLTTWGNRVTQEGPAEYDWRRNKFYTVQLNEPLPTVYRYTSGGIEPNNEETSYDIVLPISGPFGTIATDGNFLYGHTYSPDPSGLESILWKVGTGNGGTWPGGIPVEFGRLPASGSLTYHGDGNLYAPNQGQLDRVYRVVVENEAVEVCDGLDNDCNGQSDDGGACGSPDLDVNSAWARQVLGFEVQFFYGVTNRGAVASGAHADRYSIRPEGEAPIELGVLARNSISALGAQGYTNNIDMGQLPAGSYELIVEVDVNDQIGDTNRQNNTVSAPFEFAPRGSCTPDSYEANESQNDAAALPNFAWVDATLCGREEDWFALTVPADTTQQVWVRFFHNLGDIDVELFDQQGNSIDASNEQDDDEFVEVTNQSNGPRTFYLRVYQYEGRGDTNIPYNIGLWLQ